MKVILGLFALLLAVVFGILFFQGNFKKNIPFPFGTKTPTATIQTHTFKLTAAKTPKEQQVGLSEKTSLPQDEGMLFTFGKPDYYSFWMKNVKFPIDIIYINKNRIVTIIDNAQPPKSAEESLPIYKSDGPADTVLEINAGLSKKYGFKKNDEVKIDIPK